MRGWTVTRCKSPLDLGSTQSIYFFITKLAHFDIFTQLVVNLTILYQEFTLNICVALKWDGHHQVDLWH